MEYWVLNLIGRIIFACVGVAFLSFAQSQSLPPPLPGPFATELKLGMTQRDVEHIAKVRFKGLVACIGIGEVRFPTCVRLDKEKGRVVKIYAGASEEYSLGDLLKKIPTSARVVDVNSAMSAPYWGDRNAGEFKVICVDMNHFYTYQRYLDGSSIIQVVDLRWAQTFHDRLRSGGLADRKVHSGHFEEGNVLCKFD